MGFYLFTFGIIKKVYFADNIGVVVDFIYLQENYNFIELLLVIFGFSMQIYCDFSGYTDMAIGSAYIMGYKLPINFNQPYLSSSPREFWRRWHITLSNWLRDYVYIKLGGSKSSRLNTLRNLFITMILAGLWHGANLTFIVWGIFWAAAIFASSLFEKLRFLYVKIILTFILTSLLWVFFRSPNLDVALNIYVSIFKLNFSDSLITIQKYWHIFLLIIFSIVWHFFDTQAFLLRNLRSFLRWKTFFILILFLTLATQTGENNQFIYFEF
jgi:alginate O-acetyltransferase complex protein AlgI